VIALEICGGGGGQALGLEQAGFHHAGVAEIDPDACNTLRANRPWWKVIEGDIRNLDGRPYRDRIDLGAGGVPCSPFSIGGQQLGAGDERDLFPEALRLVREVRPRAVMLENVKGLGQRRFSSYRSQVLEVLWDLGYTTWWNQLQASHFGVPQLRPRMVLVAIRWQERTPFIWPVSTAEVATAGQALAGQMSERGWPWAQEWAQRCNRIAPTIVGGSKKHGGPDLGPTRARAAWRELGVNGGSIAEQAPGPDEPADHMPRLTIPMVARLQGFPGDWSFAGRKTAAYRQVGNAFPPPVARAFGLAIRRALGGTGG
jgi:DNA (cytosine-5)-methyltransferase 1